MGSNNSVLKQRTCVTRDDFSCFEDLSNELIYELFDYFSFYEINFNFGNLNQRLDDLIDTYPHYVNLQQHTSENLHLLPDYIRSLKICNRYQVPFLNSLNTRSLRGLSISNLRLEQYVSILNFIPINQLEYIYLSVYPDNLDDNRQCATIQEEVLSLGQSKLKKCIFRSRLLVDINQPPSKLHSLEYLRIDGCQNILIINNLLDHTPNLKYFRVIISNSCLIQDGHVKTVSTSNSLIYIIIQICDLKSPAELIPLFIRHCSNVKKLMIYLNPIGANDHVHKIPDIHFVNRHEWTMNIINQYLPQLRNFQIRQRVCAETNGRRDAPYYVPPYQEVLQSPPVNMFIAGNLVSLWQNTV